MKRLISSLVLILGAVPLMGCVDTTAPLPDVKIPDYTSPVGACVFIPNSATLATGGQVPHGEFEVLLWNVETGKASVRCPDPRPTTVSLESNLAASLDGKLLASGSHSEPIRIWQTATGKQQTVLAEKGVLTVVFSPDGKTLASDGKKPGSVDSDSTIRLWDVEKAELRRKLVGHTGWISSLAFSPDGKTLASGSEDRTVRLWDLAEGKELAVLTGHDSPLEAVAFAPDGKSLASADEHHHVIVWEAGTRKERFRFKTGIENLICLSYASDGKQIAVGGSAPWTDEEKKLRPPTQQNGLVTLYDAKDGKPIQALRDHDVPVCSLSFSSDGKFLAACSVSEKNPITVYVRDVKGEWVRKW